MVNILLVKKLLEICPLIEKIESRYFFKQKWLIPYLCEEEMSRFMRQGEKNELGIRRDSDGKAYYPLPQRKAHPWDLPITIQTRDNNVAMNNQESTNIASDKISKDRFQSILDTYKSKSFLSYLSTFWFFSWLSPTRSQTMQELSNVLTALENHHD